MKTFNDYYEILGADPSSTIDEIKRAYRQRARESHPDLHPSGSESQHAEMQLLNEAYQCLSNPRKRSTYDVEWKSYYGARGSRVNGDIPEKNEESGLSIGHRDVQVDSRKSEYRGNAKWTTEVTLLVVLLILLFVLTAGITIRLRDRSTNSSRFPRLQRPLSRLAPPDAPPGDPGQPGQSPPTQPETENRIRELDQQIEKNPSDLDAAFEVSQMLMNMGKADDALVRVDKALSQIESVKKDSKTDNAGNLKLIELEPAFLTTGYSASRMAGKLDRAHEYLVRLMAVVPDDMKAEVEREMKDLEAEMKGK
jgi:curved DNA-binding protein CbpA